MSTSYQQHNEGPAPMELQSHPAGYQASAPPRQGGQQYAPLVNVEDPSRDFQHHLCGCFEDCNMCCKVFWCPCVQIQRNARIRTNDPTLTDEFFSGCCNGSCWTYVGFAALGGAISGAASFNVTPIVLGSYQYTQRSRNRVYLGKPEDKCHDWVISVGCTCCALIQESREMEVRHREARNGPIPQQMV